MVGCSHEASELWKKTPRKKLRRNLFRLQVRVYKAIRAGDKPKARVPTKADSEVLRGKNAGSTSGITIKRWSPIPLKK